MSNEIAVDIDALKLDTVNDDNAGLFFQIVTCWYKEWGEKYLDGVPNTSALFVEDRGYGDLLFDPVAFTISDENDWEDADEAFGMAMEIIACNFEDFSERVEKDVYKILDGLQWFYATGYETVEENGEVIYWESNGFKHMPIQEVW